MYWVIEPLVDAGLDREQIESLIFRLGFESIVNGGRGAVTGFTDLVRDQPAQIQAAWWRAIGRMMAIPWPADSS